MEQKDYIFVNECPICNSKHIKAELELNDYFLSKEKFFINECKSCGFRFTNPQPLESEIEKYYNSNEYISHNSSNGGLMSYLYRCIRGVSMKRKYRVIRSRYEKGSILDYGCGEGEFLKYCQSHGWKCEGIELNSKARKIASNSGIDVNTPELFFSLPENKFDVITMWHVMEHIYDLKGFITQAKIVLKPDGMLVIAAPNFNSYDAKYYKKYWAAYDVPRHLWHFSSQNIEALMLDNGFKMVQKMGMRFDSFYISILSEKYKNRTNLLNSFIVGLLSNIKAKKQEFGYSSQIYLFKKNA